MIADSEGNQYESETDFIMRKTAEFSEKNKAAPVKENKYNPTVFFSGKEGDMPADESNPAYKTWIQPKVDFFKNLQGIFSGEIKPDDPRYTEVVNTTAMNAVFPIANNPGTLGSFMGIKSKTMDKTRLYEAQTMKMDGASPDEIWSKTATYQGVDGRWRQEIPDVNSKIIEDRLNIKPRIDRGSGPVTPGEITLKIENPTKPKVPDNIKDEAAWAKYGKEGKEYDRLVNIRLSDILDHPELYKAYPELKDIKIRPLDKQWEGKAGGLWDEADNAIQIGKIENLTQLRTILLHEIQHAIQSKEGFAKGGNPGMFKNKELPYLEDVFNKNKPDYEWEIKTRTGLSDTEYEQIKSDIRHGKDDTDFFNYFKEMYSKDYEKMKLLVQTEDALRKGERKNVESYMRLMGEVESRNVEKRQFFDKFDREFNSPLRTQDRPSDVQIDTKALGFN